MPPSPARAGPRARVAFATCQAYAAGSPDDHAALQTLAHEGVIAEAVVWNQPDVRWESYDLVVLRSTWDYMEQPEAFLRWIDEVAARTRLWNPAATVHWNAHKGYLVELARRGVAVVPTELLPHRRPVELAQVLSDRGWVEVVVKPAIGGNASGLFRVRPGEAAAAQPKFESLLATGDVLVQPFQAGTVARGERSLVYFDGTFSHAAAYPAVLEVNPRQPRPFTPAPSELEAADRLVSAVAPTPLYARLDYLPSDDGGWRLGELELIEPELFLRSDPDAATRFAAAIVRRLPTG